MDDITSSVQNINTWFAGHASTVGSTVGGWLGTGPDKSEQEKQKVAQGVSKRGNESVRITKATPSSSSIARPTTTRVKAVTAKSQDCASKPSQEFSPPPRTSNNQTRSSTGPRVVGVAPKVGTEPRSGHPRSGNEPRESKSAEYARTVSGGQYGRTNGGGISAGKREQGGDGSFSKGEYSKGAGKGSEGRNEEPSPSDGTPKKHNPSTRTADDQKLWNYAEAQEEFASYNPAYFLPAALKVGGNALGVASISVSYLLANAGKAITGEKLHDNFFLKNSVSAWLKLNGVTATVKFPKGESLEDIAKSPFLVSNHVSYLDGVILLTELGHPKVVSKADVQNIPMVGNYMRDMGAIFVDRDSSGGRSVALKAITDHARQWEPTTNNKPLLIFPEGSTTSGITVGTFRKGAFIPGLPVRPIVLLYTGNTDVSVPEWKKKGDELKEFSDSEWVANFLGSGFTSCVIKVCRIYYPDSEERKDPELYASHVYQYVKYEYDRLKKNHTKYLEKRKQELNEWHLGWTMHDGPKLPTKNVAQPDSDYKVYTESELQQQKKAYKQRQQQFRLNAVVASAPVGGYGGSSSSSAGANPVVIPGRSSVLGPNASVSTFKAGTNYSGGGISNVRNVDQRPAAGPGSSANLTTTGPNSGSNSYISSDLNDVSIKKRGSVEKILSQSSRQDTRDQDNREQYTRKKSISSTNNGTSSMPANRSNTDEKPSSSVPSSNPNSPNDPTFLTKHSKVTTADNSKSEEEPVIEPVSVTDSTVYHHRSYDDDDDDDALFRTGADQLGKNEAWRKEQLQKLSDAESRAHSKQPPTAAPASPPYKINSSEKS